MTAQRGWKSAAALAIVATTLVAMLLGAATPATAPAAGASDTVDLRLLTVSDWHAQLDPLSARPAGQAGGAAVLSSYFQQERREQPNTLTVTAGDAFGGSPPLASLFDEVPAVRAMNLMGFDADTLGNHNFDRGVGHLERMVAQAEFAYVSANLAKPEGVLTGVAPFVIRSVDGHKVAIIGITNPEAPTLVKPGNFGGIAVTDPVTAANRARAAARRAGAKTFIVLTHMGVERTDADGAPSGALIDFANAVGGFDVIVGDHTDVRYSGVINGALVVENRSKGLTYARVDLRIDRGTGRVLSRTSEFVTPLTSAVVPDPAVVEMLAPYREALAASFDEVVATAEGVFPRGGNIERLAEVAIGNLVADSMRSATGAQLALTNGGGIRAALPSSYLPADRSLRRTSTGYASGPPYDLVLGDAHTVLPFGNAIVTKMTSAAQLRAALEHGFSSLPAANGRFPQVSGFKVEYDVSRPVGSRVVSLTLSDGSPIVDGVHYTLATNDFLAAGGDGYAMLADGSGVTRDVMATALAEHMRAAGLLRPVIDGRLTRVG